MPEILPNWHPIVVHFVIALLVTSAALFAVGSLFSRSNIGPAATIAARCNLGIGVIVALIGLATGWRAFNSVAHNDASHANMLVHMKWAAATTALFIIAAILAWRDRRRAAGGGVALLSTLTIGSLALAATGWLGGENVYRYGLGVMSLPQADAHHHHHDGDEHHDHAPGETNDDDGVSPR